VTARNPRPSKASVTAIGWVAQEFPFRKEEEIAVAIPMTDDRRQRVTRFVERQLFAHKQDGITTEKVCDDLMAVIEAAATDDWVEMEARLAKAEVEAWDD
jgi:hypothetical protein